MTTSCEDLEIVVQSHSDGRRTGYSATYATVHYDNADGPIDSIYWTVERTKKQVYSSVFEYELVSIFNALIEHYPKYTGSAPIRVWSSERAVPSIIKKLNEVIRYCNSTEGRYNYQTMSIDEMLDVIMFDLRIFRPNIQSFQLIHNFLQKFIPILYLKHQAFTLDVKIYRATKWNKLDIQFARYRALAASVRTHVLKYVDDELKLSDAEIKEYIAEARRS